MEIIEMTQHRHPTLHTMSGWRAPNRHVMAMYVFDYY